VSLLQVVIVIIAVVNTVNLVVTIYNWRNRC
jgi:hypothetical protein